MKGKLTWKPMGLSAKKWRCAAHTRGQGVLRPFRSGGTHPSYWPTRFCPATSAKSGGKAASGLKQGSSHLTTS